MVNITSPRRPKKLSPLPLKEGRLLAAPDEACPLTAPDEACALNTITLRIKGMMCEHCEKRVCQALESVDGVVSAKADHRAGAAEVRLNASVPKERLKAAVEEAGYKLKS